MKFWRGNRIRLLRNVEEYFPALQREIDAAASEVFLETYIFEADDTGQRIAAALMRAARRGVLVHLMIDGFGSRLFPEDQRRQLLDAGVQLLVFRPELWTFRVRSTRLRRLHRKLAVVDGRIGFCGGINVIDHRDSRRNTPPRLDYAVSVEGPLIADMHAAARTLWMRTAWTQLRRRWLPLAKPVLALEPRGDQRAEFLVRDNVRHRHDIEEAYLHAIAQAHREVVIANAYFLPGRRFLNALCDAARRGVRVTLLLQGRVEYILVHYASRALYRELLDAGVQIHEYTHSFLHAKVAVVDDSWATVGSSNIDPVSLLLAREANVVVRDRTFVRELRGSLMDAIEAGAKPVQRDRWARMGLPMRMATGAAYALLRLLTGISSYGRAQDFL
ncbi:MAG TPA: cardiolipin synthase ClsB [Burkholderiales bacterium]|jgi:cardiolipin synthase|nr:cardiolipin synthase ClsB [Burkholderiales bacterium]